MKKVYFIILFSAVVLASCKKNNNDGGCISLVTGINAVSASDNAKIQVLLNNNHLVANNQVFVSFNGYEPPGANLVDTLYQTAESTQVRNNLPIFFSTLSYEFKNGIFEELVGKQYGKVTLDARPYLNLSMLRQLYLTEAINKQGIDPKYKDSCYVAQFGYINANITSSDTTSNIVKAWAVHPANSQYPACYINDVTGATVYFDSGIRFLSNNKALRKK